MSRHNLTSTMQTKTIMAVACSPQRFAAPIFGRQGKLDFWFTNSEDKAIVLVSCRRDKGSFAATVLECI